ncbi:hypothetical protein AO382_1057 [Moraxella catarrhalis]|uniref:Uncharacterized protein n=1 Tax=Moraxella catarrhalis TaxID=480 RepID=A0A7Z0UYK5_MORCA|nr:hypothetical protein AO382_1057 [Moraxella catarrhalis]
MYLIRHVFGLAFVDLMTKYALKNCHGIPQQFGKSTLISPSKAY